MKNYIFISLIFLFSGNVMAQDLMSSEVPDVIKNVFNKEFPNAKDIEWEKKGEHYKVEFEMGRNDHDVLLNSSGQIVGHKEDISNSQLPQVIKNKIKSDYKGYRIDGADKQTIGNKVLYKIEIESGRLNNKKELDLILDQEGKSYENNAWYEMNF